MSLTVSEKCLSPDLSERSGQVGQLIQLSSLNCHHFGSFKLFGNLLSLISNAYTNKYYIAYILYNYKPRQTKYNLLFYALQFALLPLPSATRNQQSQLKINRTNFPIFRNKKKGNLQQKMNHKMQQRVR